MRFWMLSKIIAIITMICIPMQSLACDLNNDVKVNADGSRTYTMDCHIFVGKLYKKEKLLEDENDELNKALDLKDLAISKQRQRADEWMNTSTQINEKLMQYDSASRTSAWIYFGIGVLTTIGAGYMASQLIKN